ncbi:MAG: hypothetical protein MMC33_002503 [Icmadophila ericetorum]|nr:hypothetical protein [Icmadophila ericetorum]
MATTTKMEDDSPSKDTIDPPSESTSHSWRFWCVFLALCLISFISGLDATIVVTALPTITREIGGQEQYVWIANSFIIASTVPQPLFAQISNIFGRRNPMLLAMMLFTLGSGIAAGARNPAMLIGGRTVQGLGIGGAYVLLDVVCCDMVPLRERGKYLPMMLSAAAIGTTVGPVIGGSLAQKNWRWIFYLNLPISGLALAITFFFLNVKYTRNPTWRHALARVDFLGNAIFIPSILAILLGLILGGTQFPWGSFHIILPLVLGFLGWALFHIHQASPICKEPSVPPRLFMNRTSATGFILTFLSSMLLQTVAYFMPVYFQAVRGTSPLRSGVDFLPYACAIIPFSIVAGVLISKVGFYRPLHLAGFALNAIGVGLLSILNENSSKAAWACFQIIAAAGIGILLSSILPAILAALPESDVATAAGTYSFVRSFGYVWGVTIPSIVFNGQFDKYSYRIGDATVRAALANGAAYGFASGGFIPELALETRIEVVGVYVTALQTVWQVAVAFSCLGFFCVFVEKHVELRRELHTEYGLEEGGRRSAAVQGQKITDSGVAEEEGRSGSEGSEETTLKGGGRGVNIQVAGGAALNEKVVPIGTA